MGVAPETGTWERICCTEITNFFKNCKNRKDKRLKKNPTTTSLYGDYFVYYSIFQLNSSSQGEIRCRETVIFFATSNVPSLFQ